MKQYYFWLLVYVIDDGTLIQRHFKTKANAMKYVKSFDLIYYMLRKVMFDDGFANIW